uniref:Putative secreted peptide n=1 Tax=Rhipicephalus pulchellus TaxID=72859 RepID=L7M9Y8_RHIPC
MEAFTSEQGTMKVNAVVLWLLPIILLTVPASTNRCPRSACSYNQPQWCSSRQNPCHCPCGQPPQRPSSCNNGAPSAAETEDELRQFPGMVPCPKHSCRCDERLTCLKKTTSCACTCVKSHQTCSYPWEISCIPRCTGGPRCLCVCDAPLPESQPKPCCTGSGQLPSPGSSLPCCNTTQLVYPPASSLPCCPQTYGRR